MQYTNVIEFVVVAVGVSLIGACETRKTLDSTHQSSATWKTSTQPQHSPPPAWPELASATRSLRSDGSQVPIAARPFAGKALFDHEEPRVLLIWHESASASQITNLLASIGARVIGAVPEHRLMQVELLPSMERQAERFDRCFAALAHNPLVRAVAPDHPIAGGTALAEDAAQDHGDGLSVLPPTPSAGDELRILVAENPAASCAFRAHRMPQVSGDDRTFIVISSDEKPADALVGKNPQCAQPASRSPALRIPLAIGAVPAGSLEVIAGTRRFSFPVSQRAVAAQEPE
jgi:hypothetical protein